MGLVQPQKWMEYVADLQKHFRLSSLRLHFQNLIFLIDSMVHGVQAKLKEIGASDLMVHDGFYFWGISGHGYVGYFEVWHGYVGYLVASASSLLCGPICNYHRRKCELTALDTQSSLPTRIITRYAGSHKIFWVITGAYASYRLYANFNKCIRE